MPKRRETPLTGKTKSGVVLTEQEELFCQLYVKNYKRIDAVMEAYDIDQTKQGWRYTASAIAYENLLKPHINQRIRDLLDGLTLTDEVVDNEMKFLIDQNAELASKAKGIEIYNKLKGRYAEDRNIAKQTAVMEEIYGRIKK
jgi:hypothetical protein